MNKFEKMHLSVMHNFEGQNYFESKFNQLTTEKS